jgi:hypothetical protein
VDLTDDTEHANEILDTFNNAPFNKNSPLWEVGIFPNLKVIVYLFISLASVY